jgi:hypothetical protein
MAAARGPGNGGHAQHGVTAGLHNCQWQQIHVSLRTNMHV